MTTASAVEPLESVRCPVCEADDSRVVYPSRRRGAAMRLDEFRPSSDAPLEDPLVECQSCRMRYVTPRVPGSCALEGYTVAIDEAFVSQAAAREATFRRSLAVVQRVWGRPPGRLLDVGTAGGSFLQGARAAGWTVTGCEPNRWLGQWGRDHYGIPVIPGTVFELQGESESFDVITLWDVLEHTADPRAVLRECWRLLAPGGLLAVNYPDIGSWIARAMGRRWPFLLSVHYHYFTRRTMRRMLETTGFSVRLMTPHVQQLECDYLLGRAEAVLGPLARWPRPWLRRARLATVQVPYWLGQTLAVAERATPQTTRLEA